METYKRGDQVEICSKEPGFEDSYYSATIISHINSTNDYIVQYNTLLRQDELIPLREFRTVDNLRPVPPEIEIKRGYNVMDEVDAYVNEGWWKGEVIRKVYENDSEIKYYVKFGRSGGEVEIGKYRFCNLRVHQEWVDGKWFCSKINNDFSIMNLRI